MARNDTVSRILKVIHLLEVHPSGLSVKELRQKLDEQGYKASERTIYRDIEALEMLRLPVIREENPNQAGQSRLRLESVASIHQKISFSYHELIALFLSRESMQIYKGSPFFRVVDQFFEKIEKGLGLGGQKELLNIQGYVGFKPSSTWQSTVQHEIMDTLYDACAEGQELQIIYKAKSGEHKDQFVPRRVGPEGLYFVDSGAYLVAKDLGKKEYRTYSVNRIVEAKKLDDEYVSSLNLKDYLKNSIGLINSGEIKPVEVFIKDPIASYVSERRWHDSQTITRVDDGVVMKMTVQINAELVRWILGLGSAAVVRAPVELIHELKNEAQNISGHYVKPLKKSA